MNKRKKIILKKKRKKGKVREKKRGKTLWITKKSTNIILKNKEIK